MCVKMTLSEALWVGYRHARYAHPDDLVTPAAILHEIRGIGQTIWETWPYRNWSVAQIRAAIADGACKWLEMRECDFVYEWPVYPGTNVPDRSPEGKFIWGGRQ